VCVCYWLGVGGGGPVIAEPQVAPEALYPESG